MIKSRIEEQVGRQRTLIERQAAFARDRIAHTTHLPISDRQRLAENLFTIIDTACFAGGKQVTRGKIANEAGMADQHGKSSRLYDYTLNPEKPDDKLRERANRRLIKKPTGYLRLAEAAARLSGVDLDQVIVELVQGTRLAEGMDELPKELEFEHLSMLAAAIQGEARRISETIGLDWYFRTIDEQGLAPNGSEWEADHQAFVWTHWTIPWVDLFTEEVAVFHGVWRPKNDDGTFGEKLPKAAWVCRRVGLALAPFGPGKTIRAYFIRRPVLVVRDFPRRYDTSNPSSIMDMMIDDPIVTSMPDRNGCVFRRDGTLQVAVEARQVALCPADDYGEDHEFIEVTPSNIAAVLETGLPTAPWISADAFYLPAAAYTKSPPGSNAASLEQVLLHGRDGGDESSRLTSRLEARASEHAQGLRAWVDARLAEIEEVMARMAAS